MQSGHKSGRNGYQLRYAAGQYVLLNMQQSGVPYEPPVVINSSGARMWKLWQEGYSEGHIAELLAGEYGISVEELRKDVRAFFEQLSARGIVTEEDVIQ